MKPNDIDLLVAAIRDVGLSYDHVDKNFEPTGVTDGLMRIADAINRLAATVESIGGRALHQMAAHGFEEPF